MNLRTAICPRKARKTRKKQDVVLAYQCRSGFVTPTETFPGLNRLRNVSDGVANPVTLSRFAKTTPPLLGIHERREKSLGEIFVLFVSFVDQCQSGFVTPTETFQGLNRLRSVSDGVANPVTLSRFAKTTPPLLGIHERREKSLGEIFVFFVSFVDQCRSGFVTPTETFQGLNRLRNVSDGVANPVTLSRFAKMTPSLPGIHERREKSLGETFVLFVSFVDQCRSGFATPTETFQGLNRLRNVSDGVANPVTLSRFAKMTPPLPGIHDRREKSLGEIFVLFVSFVDKKL